MTGNNLMRPTRRRLMATGAAGAAMAWLGPQIGWVSRAQAATPPTHSLNQARDTLASLKLTGVAAVSVPAVTAPKPAAPQSGETP